MAPTTFEVYIETTCDLGEVDLETDRDNEVLMVAEIESVLVAEVEPIDNWVAAGSIAATPVAEARTGQIVVYVFTISVK